MSWPGQGVGSEWQVAGVAEGSPVQVQQVQPGSMEEDLPGLVSEWQAPAGRTLRAGARGEYRPCTETGGGRLGSPVQHCRTEPPRVLTMFPSCIHVAPRPVSLVYWLYGVSGRQGPFRGAER